MVKVNNSDWDMSDHMEGHVQLSLDAPLRSLTQQALAMRKAAYQFPSTGWSVTWKRNPLQSNHRVPETFLVAQVAQMSRKRPENRLRCGFI